MSYNRYFFISLIVLFVPTILYGQKIMVINSTEQSWSGGIAGHYGTNYTFTIEFADYKTEPLPDTIWIGQEPVDLYTKALPNSEQGNTKLIRRKGTLKFQITIGTSHDNYTSDYPTRENEHKAVRPHAPVAYQGIALLSYRYKGKAHYYEIKRIMKVYPPVNYP